MGLRKFVCIGAIFLYFAAFAYARSSRAVERIIRIKTLIWDSSKTDTLESCFNGAFSSFPNDKINGDYRQKIVSKVADCMKDEYEFLPLQKHQHC
uniref:Secreted protein n=1 Tax=Acrobeloides nanus TaxID=290746 RepID=A0A914DTN7_9BILA